MSRLTIRFALIALVVASTGTGCQATRYQQIRDNIDSRGVEVTGAEVRWTSLIPASVVLHLNAIIWNGSDYGLEVEQAEYTVFIGGREVGGDVIHDIYLSPAALTYIPVSLEISIADLGQWVWVYLAEGVEIRVTGTMEVPIRIWGFRISSVPIAFDESTYYGLG
jgi:hypothetical protein